MVISTRSSSSTRKVRAVGHTRYYLIWKSDNNNLPGSGPCTIWAAPMSNDGLTLAGKAVAIFRPTQAWEEPVLEAPAMVIAPNGTQWMFFSSGNGYYTPRYDIGVVECSGILSGCFTHQAKPFITSNPQGPGPGEETAFVGHDGSMWLLYNPWHSRIPLAPLRPAEAVRVGWSANGTICGRSRAVPGTELTRVVLCAASVMRLQDGAGISK